VKVEKRGKYGGVKIHLDANECYTILGTTAPDADEHVILIVAPAIISKMSRKITELLEEEPDLLADRTEEEIIAILAKESEKAALQLKQAKSGSDWKKVDPEKLKIELLKHAKA
jgi:hypothetical protein